MASLNTKLMQLQVCSMVIFCLIQHRNTQYSANSGHDVVVNNVKTMGSLTEASSVAHSHKLATSTSGSTWMGDRQG